MAFAPSIPLPPIPGSTSSSTEWEFAWLDWTEGLTGILPSELYRIYDPRERIIPVFEAPPTALPGPVSLPPAPIAFPSDEFEPESVSEFAAHDDPYYEDVGDPPVPLEVRTYEPGPAETFPDLRAVLPGPLGGGRHTVSTPTSWPEYEVEEFPEGDYPEGSIFAPGGVWGGASAHDFDDPIEEDEEVPIIDGWFGDIIDVFQGQYGAPASPSFAQPAFQPSPYVSPTARPAGQAASPPGAAPMLDRYGRPCRRRRRRRLLTNSDLKDLAALKTITGNNDALKMAVIKAVR